MRKKIELRNKYGISISHSVEGVKGGVDAMDQEASGHRDILRLGAPTAEFATAEGRPAGPQRAEVRPAGPQRAEARPEAAAVAAAMTLQERREEAPPPPQTMWGELLGAAGAGSAGASLRISGEAPARRGRCCLRWAVGPALTEPTAADPDLQSA